MKINIILLIKGAIMTWGYALIILIIGFIIGVLAIYFANSNLYKKKYLEDELKKKNYELKEYHKELISHFSRGAELLDKIAEDYRQLYQNAVKSSHELMSDIPIENKNFKYRLNESELDKNKFLIDLPPKDYFEGSSGIFSLKKK